MLKVSIAKTVLSRSSWTTQTCASHQACCEAAVHAVNQIIKSEDTKAALLVDTSNAFNTFKSPGCITQYSSYMSCDIDHRKERTSGSCSNVFSSVGEEIASVEETTQGE